MIQSPVVLVCGGRFFTDFRALFKALDDLHATHPIERVVQGQCPYGGADLIGEIWAFVRGIRCDSYPPRIVDGRVLGPERNQAMLLDAKPDVVIAARGGAGTADMVRRARTAGVRVVEVPT